VCGGLGPYAPDRVRRIAELHGIEPVFAHRDESSALILDRDPFAWNGGDQRGLGWIEGDARRPSSQLAEWHAAADAGVSGLVLDGRRRFLHTAANGLAPLYWIEADGATYFSSRIDPLVRSSPSRLCIDWDAWAAVIALRYPLGERTPFMEVKRLPPQSVLRHRFGRGRVKRGRWGWTEIEPDSNLQAAAECAAAAIEETTAPFPEGTLCPLSGGRDSRMVFAPLARDGKAAGALTVPDDEGDTHEEDLAAPVARAFGVPHERLQAAIADYPTDWEERARRVEYEFVDHAWLVPLSRRLAGGPTPVPDGFAIDTFLAVGNHFYGQESTDHRRPRAAMNALFDELRRYGQAELALEERFREPLLSRTRAEFLAIARRFAGHPNQAFLVLYSTRSLRGVSAYATKLLGDSAWMAMPGASDPFARAALSLTAEAKAGGTLYPAIQEILAPKTPSLPSTAGAPRRSPHLPRRWCSPPAREMHRQLLSEGPLAPHLSPELRAWIDGGNDADPGQLRLGVESISLLHSWWRRYRDHLKEVNPGDMLG
jgi:hypothetical protein